MKQNNRDSSFHIGIFNLPQNGKSIKGSVRISSNIKTFILTQLFIQFLFLIHFLSILYTFFLYDVISYVFYIYALFSIYIGKIADVLL